MYGRNPITGIESAYAIPTDREIPKANELYPTVAYDSRGNKAIVIRASNILPHQVQRRLNSVVNEIYVGIIQQGKTSWTKVERSGSTQ